MQTPTDEQEPALDTKPDFENPFELLHSMQTQVTLHAAETPEYQVQSTPWTGIGFTLNKQQFVVAMGDVTEILPVPDATPLPGTKAWAKGIANVRGRIVPIIDLPQFLGLPKAKTRDRQRIMLVDQKQLVVGLIVDEVHGMMQFPSELLLSEPLPDSDSETDSDAMKETINYFVAGSFVAGSSVAGSDQQDKEYSVFSIDKLVNSSEFLMAANE